MEKFSYLCHLASATQLSRMFCSSILALGTIRSSWLVPHQYQSLSIHRLPQHVGRNISFLEAVYPITNVYDTCFLTCREQIQIVVIIFQVRILIFWVRMLILQVRIHITTDWNSFSMNNEKKVIVKQPSSSCVTLTA